tara:strand:- start:20 stop:616 length:597 start_codon:yes stop_codon:yes gene_type:complete
MNDSSHIYQKKKALSKFFCDELINYFESNPSQQVSGNIGLDGKFIIARDHKNSIEMDLDTHLPSNPLFTTIEIVLGKNLIEYQKLYPYTKHLNNYSIFKRANIQKYNPTGGYLTEHIEHGTTGDSTTRLLAWMFYLNDVTDKGGTRFPRHNLTLKARAGDLYIWPAYFTHSHHGVASPTQVKYIATGWVNFDQYQSLV